MTKTKRPVTESEIAEAIRALSSIHVDTAGIGELGAAFERLFIGEGEEVLPRKYSNYLETRGVAVVGKPGSGKTELISKFFENHRSFDLTAGIENSGCIHVTVPNPATIKSVGLELLRALGYPETSDRRERWAIWDMVKHRLNLLGVHALWIDEAHDLYASCSAREQDDLLKMLKSLMQGEHAVVVILSGTEPIADLMAVDRQVGRRFYKLNLPSISFSSHGAGLFDLLSTFSEWVGLSAKIDEDLVRCLIAAAQQQFGLAIEISIGAIETALRIGHETLSREDFVDFWGLQEGCCIEDNVFWTNQFVKSEAGFRSGSAHQPKKGKSK